MDQEARDRRFMRLALAEAKKGLGRTAPNPPVGAVVVRDGLVVGAGFHAKAGGPHAEVAALAAAGDGARNADLYVTLEPCNHTGRTPPCTRAILAAGIRRVVIGAMDPNPGVAGGGADFLAGHGVTVVRGVLESRCRELLRFFAKHITTGRPWVILKAGMSLDGKLATGTGHAGWITNEKSRRAVHRLRDQCDAILVGIGTVLADDPSLTARLPGCRDPLRVVLDPGLRLPPTAKMLNQPSPAATWIFCAAGKASRDKHEELAARGAVIHQVPGAPGGVDLGAVLDTLGRAGVTSLLVEGGGRVHTAFLAAGLADEFFGFVAPMFIGNDGVALFQAASPATVDQALRLRDVRYRHYGDNILVRGWM